MGRAGPGHSLVAETLVDLLAGQAEVGERVAVGWRRSPVGVCLLNGTHRVGGGAAQRQREVAVDGLDGAERICDEIVSLVADACRSATVPTVPAGCPGAGRPVNGGTRRS
jgi:hypothetical protein